MNKREAKKRVLRSMAASLRGEIDNGSEWIFAPDGEVLSDADTDRMRDAVHQLADDLDSKADKMTYVRGVK